MPKVTVILSVSEGSAGQDNTIQADPSCLGMTAALDRILQFII